MFISDTMKFILVNLINSNVWKCCMVKFSYLCMPNHHGNLIIIFRYY